MRFILLLSACLSCLSCKSQTETKTDTVEKPYEYLETRDTVPLIPPLVCKNITAYDSSFKTIHVFVALCDNAFQGIIPVPAKIGNGQNPNTNLYWGCAFGVRSFFKKSNEWELIKTEKIDTQKLERLVFRHKTKNFYLVADAYDGRYIRNCTQDFLASASGLLKDTISIDHKTIGIDGNSSLVAYIGHDGLMEFEFPKYFKNKDGKTRDCIILACTSRDFFGPYLKDTKANPLVWTASLMCPEAYTLHDAISVYLNDKSAENILTGAVKAYSKYQKIDEVSSRSILVSGW